MTSHPRSVAAQIHDVLSDWLTHDRSVLVGDSVGRGGGLGGTTCGLAERHPDRVFDTPVGDRSALGLAVGMAMGGRRVVVEIADSRSLLAAGSMVRDAVRFAASGFPLDLTIRMAGGGDAGAALDPAFADVAPGLQIHAVRAETAASTLRNALAGGLHLLVEPRTQYSDRVDAVDVDAPISRVRDGRHATVVTWGAGVDAAHTAADTLLADGIEATVVDLHRLAPLCPGIAEQVVRTGRLITVVPDGSGFGTSVQQLVLEHAFLYLESPPTRADADPASITDAVRTSVHY